MTHKYQINKKYIHQIIGDRTIIFDSDNVIIYTLNEVAAIILDSIKQRKSDKQILTILMKTYQVKEFVVVRDIQKIIKLLLKNKIICIK